MVAHHRPPDYRAGVASPHHISNVFDWLDQVRARPSMYVDEAREPLRCLEQQVHGYYVALHTHGIVEPVPAMHHHFSTWLRRRTGWELAQGWAAAIEMHTPAPRLLARFFAFVDDYRELVPTVIARVTLDAASPRDRPDVIEIVQYHPEPILFPRFHDGPRIADEHTLYRSDGSDDTTLAHAQEWAQEKLQIAPHEWTVVR